jgi:hypothetical protein
MGEDAEKVHHPGEIVPFPGVYECDCGQGHGYSTDVKGDRFPPLPQECSGSGWRLEALQNGASPQVFG